MPCPLKFADAVGLSLTVLQRKCCYCTQLHQDIPPASQRSLTFRVALVILWPLAMTRPSLTMTHLSGREVVSDSRRYGLGFTCQLIRSHEKRQRELTRQGFLFVAVHSRPAYRYGVIENAASMRFIMRAAGNPGMLASFSASCMNPRSWSVQAPEMEGNACCPCLCCSMWLADGPFPQHPCVVVGI